MSEEPRPNINTEQWEREIEQGSFGLRGSRLGHAAGARELGLAVYEVEPGKRNMPFHAHFGIEEMLIVLRGTPTLRTTDGERELAEGDVVAFPAGRDGAHQVINRSDSPVRFAMVSTKTNADLIEYPDSNKISAQGGEWGTPDAVAYMVSTEEQMGYFDGEE